MKSKVHCWFCNKESFVFIIYKNSWTCKECNQYNGFNKDGDYNRNIPEMQKENQQTFCMNNPPGTPKKHIESTNLLCKRCNASQEQKLKDLNNFEPKNEDRFDEELKLYKQKLDHIYDLCRSCKQKLNQHLNRQDQQIGHYFGNITNKPNPLTPLKTALQAKNSNLANPRKTVDNDNEFKLKKRIISNPVVDKEVVNESKSQYKKAYTVSGSSPYKQERKNMNYNTSNSSPYGKERLNMPKPVIDENPTKYINESDLDTSALKNHNDYTTKVNNLLSTNLMKSKDKWFVIQTVCVDFLSYFAILLIFSCDIVNLINDSGVWQDTNISPDHQLLPGADQNYIFKTLLRIYKYTQIQLTLILILSIFYAFKRPKMSRFLSIIGILLNLMIHLNFFGTQNDEKYVLEVIVSFCLSCYLSLARSYNVVQFYRYLTKTEVF